MKSKVTLKGVLLLGLAGASLVFLMIVLGGVVVLATFVGTAATFIGTIVLWFSGRRGGATRLLSAWALYALFYLATSTGIALMRQRFARAVTPGQELCADSGCFA